jgi:hypothetical protein
MKTLEETISSRSASSDFGGFRRRILWPFLCAVSAVFVCSTAWATQVLTPEIYESGYYGDPHTIFMYSDTPGATIFYTRGTSTCATPTHSGSTPTGTTKVFDPSHPPQVAFRSYAVFKAVGYKFGMTDSPFTICFIADNTE